MFVDVSVDVSCTSCWAINADDNYFSINLPGSNEKGKKTCIRYCSKFVSKKVFQFSDKVLGSEWEGEARMILSTTLAVRHPRRRSLGGLCKRGGALTNRITANNGFTVRLPSPFPLLSSKGF